MSKKYKILQKAWTRKLSFNFLSCFKEVYISHCTATELYTDFRIWWMMGCNKLAILRADDTFVYYSSRPSLLSQIIIHTKIIPCNENRLENNQPDLFFKINVRRPFSMSRHAPAEQHVWMYVPCIPTKLSLGECPHQLTIRKVIEKSSRFWSTYNT